jgi:hypothetical protein
MFTFQGLPSGPTVRNSGLWKPDDRKGECGRSISPRANINQVVQTVDDYLGIHLSLENGNTDFGVELGKAH